MLRTLLCDEHNQFRVVENADAISEIVKRKDRHLWLDMESPSERDFQMIQAEFNLHPLAIEDASMRHQRPKVDQYENFYFVVFYAVSSGESDDQNAQANGARQPSVSSMFHGPEIQSGSQLFATQGPGNGKQQEALSDDGRPANKYGPLYERIILREISMFLGENYLITVHNQPVSEFDEVARRWLRNVQSIMGTKVHNGHVPGTRFLTSEESKVLTQTKETSGQQLIPPHGGAGAGASSEQKTLASSPHKAASENGPAEKGAGARPQDSKMRKEEGAEAEQTNDIGILLYSLLDTVVDGYFPVIDGLVDRVEDLEEQVFVQFNPQSIEAIFSLKKDLLALRRVLAPERDVLNVLTRRDVPIFAQHTIVYFQDVYDHVVRITDSIDTYRDLLSSALDSYLSMQSNRLNITVQTLTSLSIILMSIAAVTGWYGMNFHNMPELSTDYGYAVVIVFVAIVVIAEIIFFKRKRWL